MEKSHRLQNRLLQSLSAEKAGRIAEVAGYRLHSQAEITKSKLETARKLKEKLEISELKSNMVGNKKNKLQGELMNSARSAKDVFARLEEDWLSRNQRVFVYDSPDESNTEVKPKRGKNRRKFKRHEEYLSKYTSWVDDWSPYSNRKGIPLEMSPDAKAIIKPYYWKDKDYYTNEKSILPMLSLLAANMTVDADVTPKFMNQNLAYPFKDL